VMIPRDFYFLTLVAQELHMPVGFQQEAFFIDVVQGYRAVLHPGKLLQCNELGFDHFVVLFLYLAAQSMGEVVISLLQLVKRQLHGNDDFSLYPHDALRLYTFQLWKD